MGIFQVMRWGIFITHFLHVMSRELPDYKEKFKTGEIGSVLSWLKTKIHNLWNMHDPLDFIEKVTGGPLNPHYFIDYLDLKYTQIYDLGWTIPFSILFFY